MQATGRVWGLAGAGRSVDLISDSCRLLCCDLLMLGVFSPGETQKQTGGCSWMQGVFIVTRTGGWRAQRCWELERGLGSVAAREFVGGRVMQS